MDNTKSFFPRKIHFRDSCFQFGWVAIETPAALLRLINCAIMIIIMTMIIIIIITASCLKKLSKRCSKLSHNAVKTLKIADNSAF